MVFMITFNNNVYAAELDNMQHNDQAYVLNSFSGNNLESISVRFYSSSIFPSYTWIRFLPFCFA